MGTMQALAAVALQETARQLKLDVAIKYFGSPAEELAVSRPLMVKAGLFNGVDAVIDCHADAVFKSTYGMLGTAMESFKVAFKGKTAHAAWKPWLGRSALDAVELMHAGTERMREHMPLTNRIHWATLTDSSPPNIVPENAETWYYVRAYDQDLKEAVRWVIDCARGAALMTQTTFSIEVLSAIHQRFYNPSIAKLLYENIKSVGIPSYTPEEESFAQALQREIGTEEIGLNFKMALINAEEDEFRASSSDMGDVCLVVPTGQISIPFWVPGSPAHHWAVTSAGATSIAHKGISAAAKAVVLTICDLVEKPDLLVRVKSDFEELKIEHPYSSFLPDNYRIPLDFYSD
jgi:aminobenzoyl-glutamate utilization protein B